MRKLTVFNFVTLNGFYKGPKEDTSWHRHGGEESAYSARMLQLGNTLVFGRVTYDQMAGFWPSAEAMKSLPEVAKGMNEAEKIVFSRTLKKADWNNTRLIRDNMADEIKKMKKTPGKDLTILGSGSIITQMTDLELIDEYQVMIDPVALGEGTPMFKGIRQKLDLELVDSQVFKSGCVLATYRRK